MMEYVTPHELLRVEYIYNLMISAHRLVLMIEMECTRTLNTTQW